MQFKHKIKFDDLDWIDVGDSMKYKRYQQGDAQIRLVQWGRDMLHEAWCFKGHYGYVIEGVAEIAYSGQTETYEAGDVIFIPDGQDYQHRPKVLSETFTFFSVEKNDQLR
ncbi:MAG: cupin domain-containing protein [Rhodobacterales bacterium]|jgi:mannose-6-phosphate isomerase-like protein (cupin superfamily)|nr:cupin domain-containing protein [Pseudomonadota bacterium]MDA1285860.1 cupin domain-containing protein [Pseudomonadota bacterium]NQV84740.1 cupin domain-containing protein [Rhodospirillales bacterium]HBN30827.1 hypothetical protein [Paracoccaceae bacterium]